MKKSEMTLVVAPGICGKEAISDVRLFNQKKKMKMMG